MMDENERIARQLMSGWEGMGKFGDQAVQQTVSRIAAALAQARREGEQAEAKVWAREILNGDGAFTCEEIQARWEKQRSSRQEFSADDAASLVAYLIYDLRQARREGAQAVRETAP